MNDPDATIEFTLQPPNGGDVAVRLRRYLDRWMAELVGRSQPVAIGLTAREALTAALLPLGDRQVAGLLAELGLLEPSLRVVMVERATRRAEATA